MTNLLSRNSPTPTMRLALAALLVLAALSQACGGTATTGGTTSAAGSQRNGRSPAAVVGGGGSVEDAMQLCHANGASDRTDYATIAGYRCPDGSVPLAGDPMRAARARVGNVGAGPDGHIVDLYEIPCPTPVRVFVDMYHCGQGVEAEIDPNRLHRAQLVNLARSIRTVHGVPFDPRAVEHRAYLLTWLSQTPQVRVVTCPDYDTFLPGAPETYPREFLLSMAASLVELGVESPEPGALLERTLQGVLDHYAAVVAQVGEAARVPALDEIATKRANGSLRAFADDAASRCDLSRARIQFFD